MNEYLKSFLITLAIVAIMLGSLWFLITFEFLAPFVFGVIVFVLIWVYIWLIVRD